VLGRLLGAYRLAVSLSLRHPGEASVARQKERVYFGETFCTAFWRLGRTHISPAEKSGKVPTISIDRPPFTMGYLPQPARADPRWETAKFSPGETVLILGGTGTLGQIALQLGLSGSGQGRCRSRSDKQLWHA